MTVYCISDFSQYLQAATQAANTSTTDGSTIGHLLFADPGGRAILVRPRPVSYPVSYRLQSVLNAAARLVCNSRKYNRISLLLRDLHWLRVPERIKFRLVVMVFRCHNQTAPECLSRELQWTVEVESRRQLRSASSQRLVVRRTRLRTVGDRASFLEQPASGRCRFSFAGNFQGAPENIFVRSVV